MIEFNNVFFRNLEDKEDDYKLLYKWFSQKFIYEWFEQRKLSYEEIKNKYKNKLKNKEQDLFIITYNNINIGLVQIYKYNNDISLKELKNYKNIYEYVGKDTLGNNEKIIVYLNKKGV